jgi:hypothetical protein
MTQQHCHQHDLTFTSRCGQVISTASSSAWFCSNVASMTQHLHRVVAKLPWQRCHQHDSATLSLGWLELYITSWPSCLGSAIASITWQYYHQHDSIFKSCHGQIASTASSSAWLDNIIASMTLQLYHQHDSATPSPAWLGINVTQQLDHQNQKHLTSATSWHVASSYWYYSQLCLVLGPMQTSCCTAWHIRKAYMF